MCLVDEDEEREMLNTPDVQAVGIIMYDMLCTKLNLSFAINLISRFQSNLGEVHSWDLKRLLKYIKSTKDYNY